MKIALWAKDTITNEHYFWKEVEVRNGSQTYHEAVKQPISVFASPTPEIALSQPTFYKREFQIFVDPLARALEKVPRFLEI